MGNFPVGYFYFLLFALLGCWFLDKDPMREAGKKQGIVAGGLILWGIFLLVFFMGFYEPGVMKKSGIMGYPKRFLKNQEIGIAIGGSFSFLGFMLVLQGQIPSEKRKKLKHQSRENLEKTRETKP